jgi:PEP-CTERM motif
MSTPNSAKRRALNLAVSAVGITLPVLAGMSIADLMTSYAYADLANGYTNESPPGGNWPGTPVYESTVPGSVATAQGPPTAGATAAYTVVAETITPTSTFTLGRIDIIASGGGGAPVILNMFALNPTSAAAETTPGYNTGSAFYAPSNNAGPDLLGNGNGEPFNFFGFSDTEDMGFSLTQGPNINDQITLTAGTTYAIEFWEPTALTNTANGTPATTLYWWRETGAPLLNDGQAFSAPDAGLGLSRQTLTANGQAGGAPRTFAVALYQPYIWDQSTGADFNTGSNWLNGIVPTGVGQEADFDTAITAPSTVTSAAPITLGLVNFNSPNEYTLGQATGGGGSLLLNAVGGTSAYVNVAVGNAEIDLPTSIVGSATMKVATGGTLTFGSPVLAGSNTFVQASGTTVLNGGLTDNNGGTSGIGQVSVTGGVLQLGHNSGVSSIGTLAVSGGTLDIGNNTLLINYALQAGANPVTDPIATIVSYLTAGYASKWLDTPGAIVSSDVATDDAAQSKTLYDVGYADEADGIITATPSGVIEILPTIAGDAKLQGNVVFGDFQVLAQFFGKPGAWDQGNFSYGSTVSFGDFQMLAQDFGQSSSGLTSGEFTSMNNFAEGFGYTLVPNSDGVGFSLVAVPEPASIGLLSLGAIGLLGRRRRTT